MRGILIALCLLLPGLTVRPAAGQAPDSARVERVEPLFTKRDLYFAGAFAAGTVALWPLDVRIAAEVRDSVLQENAGVRDLAGVFRVLGWPGSLALSGSAYVVGLAADRPRLADLGLHTTEAIVVAEAITFPLKGLLGRARPSVDVNEPHDFVLGRGIEGDPYQSFPSGHTSAAFATAAAVTTELSEWWPERKPIIASVLFAGATLVGISRMYENHHWASDVAAGAAIGSFSGWKVVRYHHSRPDDWVDRLLLPRAVVPLGGGGVALVWARRL